MTLPSHAYSRDPLDILIDRQKREQPCKGCLHDNSMMVFGKIVMDCAIGRRRANGKCYVEKTGTTCQGGK